MKKFYFLFFLGLIFVGGIYSCSSLGSQVSDEEDVANSNDNTGDNDDSGQSNADDEDNINLAKLEGTPFEGRETGDDLYWETFIEEPYLTNSVDEVPILVFLAYFSNSEELVIEEGIEIANDAIGFDAFEVVEDWADTARPIIKVNEIADSTYQGGSQIEAAIGVTRSVSYNYEEKIFSDEVVTDWQVEVEANTLSQWVIAHELGHAFGIISHALINYEDDILGSLSENSLMLATLPADPNLDDYTYMMQTQGEVLLRHLGEVGTRTLVK